MAEGAGLENRYTRKGIVGSNPTLSVVLPHAPPSRDLPGWSSSGSSDCGSGLARLHRAVQLLSFRSHAWYSPPDEDPSLMSGLTTSAGDVEFFSHLLHAVRDSVIYTDLDGRVRYWNQGAVEVFGYSADEMLGRSAALLYPDEAPDHLKGDLGRILDGDGVSGEWCGRRKDGESVWVDIKATLVRDREGQAIGFIGVAKDITERKRTEQALRASEERYRAFIEQTAEGVWRVELEEPMPLGLPEDDQVDHFYAYAVMGECNDAMARMYGLESASDLAGVALGDLLPRSDPHNVDFLRSWVRNGYRLIEAESHERDVHGRDRYFLNNFIGIIENGLLRAGLGLAARHHRAAARRRATCGRWIGSRRWAARRRGGPRSQQPDVGDPRMRRVRAQADDFPDDRQPGRRSTSGGPPSARPASPSSCWPSAAGSCSSCRSLEVNATVRQLEPILRRTLLPDSASLVSCPTRTRSGVGRSGQLDQVLLNLTLNARDAMPSGRGLTVETSTVQLSAAVCGRAEGTEVPGPYLMIAVSDTGHGMDRETMSRRLRALLHHQGGGRGPGSGSPPSTASSSSAADSSGPYSEPGAGTTFKTYLPLADRRSPAGHDDTGDLRAQHGETDPPRRG